MGHFAAIRRADPRLYQIAALSLLLSWGIFRLDFRLSPLSAVAVVGAALLVQYAATRIVGLPRFDPRSALISATSLLILLRSTSTFILVIAAAVAIGSKFLLRFDDRHIFNPSAIGIVVATLLFEGTWIAPGQWGTATLFAFAVLCIGSVVATRAARADISFGFLGFYALILFGRAIRLGDPLSIPLHELSSGALLVFAFFMISDPKTTPSTRTGRILFAAMVAVVAAYVRFNFFRSEGALWALVGLAPIVPLIDRLLPGTIYRWSPADIRMTRKKGVFSMRLKTLSLITILILIGAVRADAFCGFYVAKADTSLYNQASQVAIVHDGDRTVITMANDFQGEPKEFAVVIPVPAVLERGQINVADKALLDHLDAYTSPRLVEYHDGNPCAIRYEMMEDGLRFPAAAPTEQMKRSAKSRGVTIEASYTVGEYDILILSARESHGLEQWLRENEYSIPDGASRILQSYIRQGLKFFVAKVNLEEKQKLGYSYLRPLQVAYESRRFMLPIRLGTVNARGSQELFVYVLTRSGRVETTNYRTVRLPSDVEIPTWVKGEFDDFYRAMFTRQVEKERMKAVFLEYAWDMSWCDPCAADPLSADELRRLGVFWIDRGSRSMRGENVFVTRLHVRYDEETFPDDLMFKETGDRTNFQARYVMRHPWKGEAGCPAYEAYLENLRERQEREARALEKLTGWDLATIREKSGLDEPRRKGKWWETIWGAIVTGWSLLKL